MLATDRTVRMRPVGNDAKTVRQRIVDVAVKPLPSVIADRIPRSVAHRQGKSS